MSRIDVFDRLYTRFPEAKASDVAEAYELVLRSQTMAQDADTGDMRFFNELGGLKGSTGLLRVRLLVRQPCEDGERTGSIDVIVGANEAIGSVLQYGEQYAEEVLSQGLSERASGGPGPCTGRPDIDIVLIQDAVDPFSETSRPPYGGR